MAQRRTPLAQRAQPTDSETLLTAAQVGAMLGGSTNATVRDLMRAEGVPVTMLGGRFFYPKATVLAVIQRNTIKAVKGAKR